MRRSTFFTTIICTVLFLSSMPLRAQRLLPFRLPETGQYTGYTTTAGEDADYIINPLSFTDNGNGTITDNNTGLIWQKTDGGEMTIENATTYCDNLNLAGYTDWRLPTGAELLSINDYSHINPALDTAYFTKTAAGYWWTGERQADDNNKVWVVNAGGGIGAHPKTETVSAGGTKKMHVRAVRDPITTIFSVTGFTDNGNGTITDHNTGLTWQKTAASGSMTWDDALIYAGNSTLAGMTDWRLPDIKELQSLNRVSEYHPSFDTVFFTGLHSADFWSSTTLMQTPSKAWDINTDYGIVTQHDKSMNENVLLVRGGNDNKYLNITEVLIPGGAYEMGDHFGFVDPQHPSDELPVHTVYVDSLFVSSTEITNQQFLAFLNASLLEGTLHVTGNRVYLNTDTSTLCYTSQYAPYYSISYNGNVFTMADFRGNHPMVGVRWYGAAAFCNWLSVQNGYQPCYDISTWDCDFTADGYRLPTEAEWEYSARGGHTNPYFNYPWGDDQDTTKANWPNSGDPYEVGSYPLTTPVGFYDGTLKQRSDYNWPENSASYQTANGSNSFGLYDVAGNVWEFVNDWYGQDYYSSSPYSNPKGPATGFIMPDGKPYRGMRGGNWYNGYSITPINDGHSRVSNRNPSYYRGPQDPNHPWYHIGFRLARRFTGVSGMGEYRYDDLRLQQNFPNPFNGVTTITFTSEKTEKVSLIIYNSFGQPVETLLNETVIAGKQSVRWNAEEVPSGIYTCILRAGSTNAEMKMILIRQ